MAIIPYMESKNLPMPPHTSASFFSTPAALSAHQSDRELAVAIRVRQMNPTQFSRWLDVEWGRVQTLANAALPEASPALGTARCFATLAEKNRHDEDKELATALMLAATRRLHK